MKILNRIEEKKLKKEIIKEKSKRTAIILICLVFFIGMIYITDTATSRMLQKSDDKHAFYINMKEDGIIRMDIAGKTLELYINPVIDVLKGLYIKITEGISAM